ncbi:HDOD domain-containing protein [Galenea microaerophila]
MVQTKLRNAMKIIQGTPLPELPEEVLLLEKELKSRFANLEKISSIIEKNTVMAGDVLEAVNSPVMNMKQEEPVKSIFQAVNLLGLENIYNLLVASALKRLFSGNAFYKDMMDFSVDVAFCMADISEWVNDVTRDEAYMLGLFHNVGALVLVDKDAEGYGKIYSNSLSQPVSVIEVEQAHYGTDHQLIGVLVAKKWNLSIDFLNAIMLHHTYPCTQIKEDRVRALVAMIQLANAIVAEISLGAYVSQEMQDFEAHAIQELMIPPDVVSEIRSALMSYSFKE